MKDRKQYFVTLLLKPCVVALVSCSGKKTPKKPGHKTNTGSDVRVSHYFVEWLYIGP